MKMVSPKNSKINQYLYRCHFWWT